MFQNQVFSQVSAEFVTPLFPKDGEKVTIRIAFSQELAPEEVFLVTNKNGVNCRICMSAEADGTYSATVEAQYRPAYLRYYFIFRIRGRYYYYSKRKSDVFAPPAKDQFILRSGLDVPLWIAGSTCYQIFPDRFCNGDPSLDIKDGAYEYDGGVVNTHTFDEKPQPFEKSRCLDFFNGDLKGVEEKIPYLKSMGFNLIYLNPVNASLTVHRYDSTDYFQVDAKLGGDQALESLIRRCHENGIRVIVDISINHTGSAHKWFLKAQEDPSAEEASYYYRNPDGSFMYWAGVKTLPQLNYNSQKLRDIVYRSEASAMQKYLKAPFFQDGWRLDVAPELGRCGSDELTYEVWREVRSSLKKVNPQIYLVGEDWNDASEYLEGDMWDATMDYYGSGRLLRSWMGERDRFLTGGWGHSPQCDNAMNAYDLERAFSETMNAQIDQMKFMRMNLIDSHDTPRLHNNGEIYDQDIYEGVVMALYLLPGMPNIYYGDEIGLDGKMGSVEDSRYPMCWDEGKWNQQTREVHKVMGMLRTYDKELAFASTYYEALSPFCLIIIRKTSEASYMLILNKSARHSDYVITNPVLAEYTYAEDLFQRSQIEMDGAKIVVSVPPRISTVIKLS